MYIDPGELNKRIEIYKRVVPAPDADGYATPSLVCVRRPWAKVSNFTAKEVAMHDADYLSSTVRFLIRSRPGLTRKMLVKCGETYYEIDHVAALGDHDEYTAVYAKLSTLEAAP